MSPKAAKNAAGESKRLPEAPGAGGSAAALPGDASAGAGGTVLAGAGQTALFDFAGKAGETAHAAAAVAGETATPKAKGLKRAGDPDEIAIPAKELRIEPAVASPELACPELPPDDSTADSWVTLKDLIPWVKQELGKSSVVRENMPARPLWQYPPLGVVCHVNENFSVALSSYMAPWDDAIALPTLKATSLYQFGGNVAWLSASVHGPVPVVRLAWQHVRELANTFFAKVPGGMCGARDASCGPASCRLSSGSWASSKGLAGKEPARPLCLPGRASSGPGTWR